MSENMTRQCHHVRPSFFAYLRVRRLEDGGVVLEVPLDDALAGRPHLQLVGVADGRVVGVLHGPGLLPGHALEDPRLWTGVHAARPPPLLHLGVTAKRQRYAFHFANGQPKTANLVRSGQTKQRWAPAIFLQSWALVFFIFY